jgi:hypothetical protein
MELFFSMVQNFLTSLQTGKTLEFINGGDDSAICGAQTRSCCSYLVAFIFDNG